MTNYSGFLLDSTELPTISDADIAHIKPPYVHFHWNNPLLPCSLKEISDNPKAGCFFPKFFQLKSNDRITRTLHLMEKLVETFRIRNDHTKTISASVLVQFLFELSEDFSKGVSLLGASVPAKVQGTLNELKLYLEQNYASEITGNLIGDRFHYHFDYLNREYKKWTGETIFSCLKRIRIERAKQLLSTGYYTVEEVARQTGYKDTSYFSKVFLAATKITPGKWV